jgi:hypothetical protein
MRAAIPILLGSFSIVACGAAVETASGGAGSDAGMDALPGKDVSSTEVSSPSDGGPYMPCGQACAGTCALGRCLVTLAADQYPFVPLVVDDAYVYWSNCCNGGGGLVRVPITGGTVSTLVGGASGAAYGIAVDATSVYWTSGSRGAVSRIPKGGGTVSMLAEGQSFAYGLARDATTLFWSNYSAPGVIASVAIDGGAIKTIASNQNSPAAVAVEGTRVYWLTSEGALVTSPIGGGVPMTLAAGNGGSATALATDATDVYWSDATQSVVKMPLGGGDITTLTPSSGLVPTSIVVDAANVYWTAIGGDAAYDSPVLKVSKAGGTPVTLATAKLNGAIAVDDTSVYFSETAYGHGDAAVAGSIVRLTPK